MKAFQRSMQTHIYSLVACFVTPTMRVISTLTPDS